MIPDDDTLSDALKESTRILLSAQGIEEIGAALAARQRVIDRLDESPAAELTAPLEQALRAGEWAGRRLQEFRRLEREETAALNRLRTGLQGLLPPRTNNITCLG